MKILLLAPQWPDPPRQGAAIRNLQIVLHLAQRHEVYLQTFAAEQMETERLRRVCRHAEAVPMPVRTSSERLRQFALSPMPDMAWRLRSHAQMQRVRKLCRQVAFDAVHIEGIEMAPYGIAAARSGGGLLYDAHNAEFVLQRRALLTDLPRARRFPKAVYSLVQWLRLRRFERQVCLASNCVLAVSEEDRAALARLAPERAGAMRVLPNGVDPAYWSRTPAYPAAPLGGADNLVFDGTMDFRPNVDAVLWFASEVWPHVRRARPDAQFYIVGRNPSAEVLALGRRPGITVTGAVDDTRGWVAGATVYVVPMRMGGGVRLKVLQAMAMGCAIVSTPMGAEGITVQDGKEMLFAPTAVGFSRAVLRLLQDAELRAALGSAARRTAVTRYAWERLLPVLDEVYG